MLGSVHSTHIIVHYRGDSLQLDTEKKGHRYPSAIITMLPATPVLTVVGGKVITSYSSNGQFPLNGQQLMMQLDSLTGAMTDMAVTTKDEMEVNREQFFVRKYLRF